MPWVRIDDRFPDNPKIVAVGPSAAYLYVTALCYCNRELTNGFIPLGQVDRLVALRQDQDIHDGPLQLARRLCEFGLWATVERRGVAGFVVHDYLKYQGSKRQILEARAKTATRQGRFRNGHRNAVSNGGGNAAPTPTPTPTPTLSDKPPTARSKRPVYTSDRFAVFEWQLDELSKVLGAHFEDFDLHAFFDALTQRSRADGLVIPKPDVWNWLQAQVIAEAQRRGLPMAQITAAAPTNKRIAGLVTGGNAFLNRNHP